MPPPLISIIILNWNGSKCIGECLESIVKTSYRPIEILVVDNGSIDDSRTIIKKFENVILFELPENIGFAAGNNAGFKKAAGTYIATLNNDVIVEPDWLRQPAAIFEQFDNVGIIACRQMKYHSRQTIDCLYTYPLKSLLFKPMGSFKNYKKSEKYSQPGFVLGAGGASAIYAKKLLDDLCGFDERYYSYHEESDLCMRAFLSGWKCAYAPEAVVYHRGSFSFKTIPKKMAYYHERNRVWFIYKFYPLPYILKNAPWIILWQLRVWRVLLFKIRVGWICFSALYVGMKGCSAFREDRKKNVAKFKECQRLFDGFVRRKKIPL